MWQPTMIFLLALLLISQIAAQQDGGVEIKTASIDPAPMTDDEVKAYAGNPDNQLKPDPNPSKKGVKPHRNAGVSSKKVASQIVGGNQATQGMFPWQVYIHARVTSAPNPSWLCGGSIISQTAVLTAAHCVRGGTYFIARAGGINRDTTEPGEVNKVASSFVIHSGYNPTTLVNDIAVLKFSSPWIFNSYINAVRLPKWSQQSTTFDGTSAIASGYGKITTSSTTASNFLNYAFLSVISNSVCAAHYGSTTITSGSICTGYNSARAVCSGDSGGPLVVREADGKYTLIGVTSFVSSAGCNGNPNGFTRVSAFLSWINTNTGLAILP